jgi:hypothetical protein
MFMDKYSFPNFHSHIKFSFPIFHTQMGKGKGKACSDSENCYSRLSTVYLPKLAGQPETERHSKLHMIKKIILTLQRLVVRVRVRVM